jgi:hypothetical protein
VNYDNKNVPKIRLSLVPLFLTPQWHHLNVARTQLGTISSPVDYTGLESYSQKTSMNNLRSITEFLPPGRYPYSMYSILINAPGYWRIDQHRQDNYFRPCLVVGKLPESKSVLIMIGSTQPYIPHRWIPFEGSPHLPGQPSSSVKIQTPEATSARDGYLCYTHVLNVKPVLRWAEKPSARHPGIVHVSPPAVEELLTLKCLNVDEILDKHRSYWEKRGQKNTKGDDDSDNFGGNEQSMDRGNSSSDTGGSEQAGDNSNSSEKGTYPGINPSDTESAGFLFHHISLKNAECLPVSDEHYQAAISKALGKELKLLTALGPVEEEIARSLGDGNWTFPDDESDESVDVDDELPFYEFVPMTNVPLIFA